MPRGKKNKGNSGSAPPPNNNKNKSPAEPKVPDTILTLQPDPLPIESDKSNDDLKLRLANAKERLHLLQEVIGGIGDPMDVDNFKASGIDAAKEKLNIIQDSVNAVKSTLLEVRQDSARSVTPESTSPSGTSKRRKNKKHHNQNPPQGFVVREQSSAPVESKLEPDGAKNAIAANEQEGGTSTISKRKRNRNKKKKAQQEESPESVTQALEATAVSQTEDVKIVDSPIELKENSPEANKSKNNKKNKKKGQQSSTSDVKVAASEAAAATAVQAIDASKTSLEEVKEDNQKDNQNQKNKKKKGEGNKDTEKVSTVVTKDKLTGYQKATSKIEKGSSDIIEGKTDNTEKLGENKSDDIGSPAKARDDPLSQKQNDTITSNINANEKNQSNKNKKNQKKGKTAEEKPVVNTENVLLSCISKPAEDQLKSEKLADEQQATAKSEPLDADSLKNKKDKKKGKILDSKLSVASKVEEKQIESKENVLLEQTSKSVVEVTSSELINTTTATTTPTNQTKDIEIEPVKEPQKEVTSTNKNERSTAQSEPAKDISVTETTPELVVDVSTPPIAAKKTNEKNDFKNETCPQTSKNKKNKHAAPAKISDKQDETLIIEQAPTLITDKPSTEQVVTDVSEAISQLQCQEEITKKEKRTNEAQNIASTPEIVSKLPDKEEQTGKETNLEALVSTAKIESKSVSDNSKDIERANESSKTNLIVGEDTKAIESKTELSINSSTTPCLPKLDFSQVVKDNKDKIPLMEVKASPISTSPSEVVDTKGNIEGAVKPLAEGSDNLAANPIMDVADKTTAVEMSKPSVDITVEPIKAALPIVQDTPAVEASSTPKPNKAKTPERKGNQRNEPKKPQHGKAQSGKQKQDEQKQILKKEDVKDIETIKVDNKKEENKSDPTVTILPTAEITKINENIKKEQVQQKDDEEKLEIKSETLVVVKEDVKGKEAPKEVVPQPTIQVSVKSTEKQQPLIGEKADNDSNKKSVESVVAAEKLKSVEIPVRNIKSVSPIPEKSANQQQPEQQKQKLKADISKKDQKKQNKMKGKAPQPPDIPMDMSLLSASMIDPTTVAVDEIISHEQSEDRSSLITSDSKNVQGSDFVPSADCSVNKAVTDETKSQETISVIPKNENKVTEIVREEQNLSPTSSKRNKDVANLLESDEMQEMKRQELPEKSAQQKLEPVQFPAVKLMDILEAKMTSPTVKRGNIAGNVRKLPKDNKRTDQLNVQQQKPRSKSPKENMAEKFVKNQKLASGDSKKQVAENLKKEILNTEVRSLVTPREKEAKSIKIDANLSATSKLGTAPITTAITEVDNLRKSDDHSKQKTESLPENQTISDTKSNQPTDDDKTQKIDVTVAGKDEIVNTKPKIGPKPEVLVKSPPKNIDRSNKSPAKSCESKNARKECPVQSPTQSKSPTQPKSPAQSKSAPQSKSPSQAVVAPTSSTKSTSPKSTDPECTSTNKPQVPPKPNLDKKSPNKVSPIPSPDEEEEFVEYKFTPRPVFIATTCQICKVPLESPNLCKLCQMVSYCSDQHENEDKILHGPLCNAIQEIAKKRGGHIYNNARILSDDDYRSLRVHTLNLCENFLKRNLFPFEREILLFPRLCCARTCREWRQQSLIECKQCGQVSYCAAYPEHLPQIHEKWCKSFNLYQKIVLRQKNFGRIEPSLPSKIMLKPYPLSDNIDDVFKNLYKNYGAIKDECIYATLTNLATAPLTVLYGAQINQQEIGEVYTIHLVGAELQFEADTLDKWETFFLHLVPSLVECRIVFVGPELNAENLPLEILSRIRMCRTCRQNCRIVKFDFQCGILYHDYVNSSAFTKPDLICFFNPGLYRSTGFNGLDTWPNTIKSATLMNCPIVVTSYTEIESPRDLERMQRESDRSLSVVQSPQINPFASQRPERNFISDEVAPMIFKNFFCFCVK